MRVTVIGGGVIGLSSALALRDEGHDVSVVAADTSPSITSYAAGAIWFPFHSWPPERVNGWALTTQEWLSKLARDTPEAGVDVLRLFVYVDDESPRWWLPSAPDARLVRQGLPGRDGSSRKAGLAWTFAAPRVEPAVFMQWLRAGLAQRGVATVQHRVKALSEIDADLIVNCTGLGARALTNDNQLRARYGGIVVTEPGDIDMSVSISDDRFPGELFYSIPRRNEVVLGGSAEDCDDGRGPEITPELQQAILERARLAGLKPGPLIRSYGALRPFREAVRLERDPADPRVIHNYGHGGAGYTICRGCALEVARIASRSA